MCRYFSVPNNQDNITELLLLQITFHFSECLLSMVHSLIASVNRSAGRLAVSVSLVASLWSASNGVNAIQRGLRKISGRAGTFLKQRGAALLITVNAIVIVVKTITTASSALSERLTFVILEFPPFKMYIRGVFSCGRQILKNPKSKITRRNPAE